MKLHNVSVEKWAYVVYVQYSGISHYKYRNVGDVISRHKTHAAAERSAGRSTKFAIADTRDARSASH